MNSLLPRVGVAVLGALFGLACEKSSSHAPLISSCDPGQPCPINPILGGNPGGSGGSGSGGNTSTAGAAGIGAGTVRGYVVDLVDDTFVTAVSDTQNAIVEGQGQTTPIVSAVWNGVDPFTLSGMLVSEHAWISVRPANGTASVRTLNPIATNTYASVTLGLVQADVLDSILRGLSRPLTRTSGRAQVVLKTVSSKTSQGLAGVRADAANADGVAYRFGGIWSTDQSATDSSGLLLIANLPAVAFPGTTAHITLSGVVAGTVDVDIASDGVTLATIPLSL